MYAPARTYIHTYIHRCRLQVSCMYSPRRHHSQTPQMSHQGGTIACTQTFCLLAEPERGGQNFSHSVIQRQRGLKCQSSCDKTSEGAQMSVILCESMCVCVCICTWKISYMGVMREPSVIPVEYPHESAN